LRTQVEELPPDTERMSTQLILSGPPPTTGQRAVGTTPRTEASDTAEATALRSQETDALAAEADGKAAMEKDGHETLPADTPAGATTAVLGDEHVVAPNNALLDAMLKFTELIGFDALEYFPDVQLPPPTKPLAPTGSKRWWLGF
jgi:hypothetical protein